MDWEPELKRILVVEDDSDLREIIEDALTAHSYKVMGTDSGDQARRLMRAWTPDLALIDICLPDANGFDICEWAGGVRLLDHMPVILISGHTDLAYRLQGFLKGAARYVCKPFDIDNLIREVKALAGPSSLGPCSNLQ